MNSEVCRSRQFFFASNPNAEQLRAYSILLREIEKYEHRIDFLKKEKPIQPVTRVVIEHLKERWPCIESTQASQIKKEPDYSIRTGESMKAPYIPVYPTELIGYDTLSIKEKARYFKLKDDASR